VRIDTKVQWMFAGLPAHRCRGEKVSSTGRTPKDSAKPALPLVVVVDDDLSVREALPVLVRELGYAARTFASAEEFLASECVTETACLLLDVAMPGMTGPELQLELTRRGLEVPIVFITALRGDATRADLLVGGAVECLLKPFSEGELLAALEAAMPVGGREPL
jgi:FixJ family two-component response regulator